MMLLLRGSLDADRPKLSAFPEFIRPWPAQDQAA
jgi:hypothetical protein